MKTLLLATVLVSQTSTLAQLKTEDLGHRTIDEIQSTDNRPLTKKEQVQMTEKLMELEKIRKEHAEYLKELEKEP